MSHFTDIGFRVERQEDIITLFSSFKHESKKQVFGKYIQYITQDESGARLYWYYRKGSLFHKEQFLGVMPAFKGSLSQNIRKPGLIPNHDWPLEPSLDLWVNNSETNDEYPLVVDISNYLEVQNSDLTKLTHINGTLFANHFEFYKSEDEFWKRNPKKDGVHIPAPGMFIPTGTFSPKNDSNFIPHAECWCYGKIVNAEKLINKLTGLEFYHFIMETLAATYDVVVGPQIPIDLGRVTIIGGTFWPCTIL